MSATAEIEGLIANGTFEIVHYDMLTDDERQGRIFNSRLVNEIKNKEGLPYEKSRLVVQGYNDMGKTSILTQAPTIQRSSQRLLISLIPTLMQFGLVVEIRDITQAYIQSHTKLRRVIISELPLQMRDKYPAGSLLRLIKPLYGIAKARIY